MHSPFQGARAFIPLVLAGIVLLGLASTPVAAAGPTTEAQQIIHVAKQQLGDPWVYGATGPRAFDCSGLVVYAFRAAGDAAATHRLRTAAAMLRWYQAHGLASRTNPKPGDLVVWGGGSHIGIYIGGGKAISTLTNGVHIHGVFAVTARFTAFLHTGMWKKSGGLTVATAHTAKAARLHHTRSAANLRTRPTVHAARIAVIPQGRSLLVLGSRHDASGHTWFKVRVGTRTGWVASWLIR